MPRINITFRAETQTSTTGTISHTTEVSQELYEAIKQSVYFGNSDAHNWIKNNLFGRVQELGIRDDWRPIDVLVTRL